MLSGEARIFQVIHYGLLQLGDYELDMFTCNWVVVGMPDLQSFTVFLYLLHAVTLMFNASRDYFAHNPLVSVVFF